MSGNTNNSPMLKAAGLWAKTSVKGGQYLTGRLGGVKVLVMENRDRQSDDDPSHILYFVEAQERRQERGDGARVQYPGRLRRHQRRTAGASRHRRRSTAICRMRRSGRGETARTTAPPRRRGSSVGLPEPRPADVLSCPERRVAKAD